MTSVGSGSPVIIAPMFLFPRRQAVTTTVTEVVLVARAILGSLVSMGARQRPSLPALRHNTEPALEIIHGQAVVVTMKQHLRKESEFTMSLS